MFPNMTNVTGFPGMMEYNNTVTDGMFGLWIIIGVWMVMFLATANRPKPVSLTFASFVTLVVSVLLSGLGIVSGDIVVVMAILSVAAFGYLTVQSKNNPYS